MYSEDTRDITSAQEKSKAFAENAKIEQAKSNFKNAQKR